MNHQYRICTRCIMDTTDPEIVFNEEGICNHCEEALKRIKHQLLPLPERAKALTALVEVIKREGRGKEYDCVIGVSGGVDSTMTAYYVKKLGLRPLAVHFDNGWDSELAVSNIHQALRRLDIELYTYVVDWPEFRDLLLAFLKSSVANCEAPTDHGITATLFKTAARLRTRFILSGSNLATESIMPHSWGHFNQDLRLLQSIHRRFGTQPLHTMPTISIVDYLSFVFVKRMRQIPFLNYVDYRRADAGKILTEELGWRDYGAKHYESVWTRFFQAYYLPTKFGYDKRRAHLSSMICSKQITRESALEMMTKPAYTDELLRQDMAFVLKKFGLTEKMFRRIIETPPRSAHDYPSHYFLFRRLERLKNIFRKIATSP